MGDFTNTLTRWIYSNDLHIGYLLTPILLLVIILWLGGAVLTGRLSGKIRVVHWFYIGYTSFLVSGWYRSGALFQCLGFGLPPKMPNLRKSPREGFVRFVAISDTHNLHRQLDMPDGDVLLHAGDITETGAERHLKDFNDWLGSLPYKRKIVIGGNHDLTMDPEGYAKIYSMFHYDKEKTFNGSQMKKLLTNGDYLLHESLEVEGVKIFGSPYQPFYPGAARMAFNVDAENLQSVWDDIPKDIDILLTHTPPRGLGDKSLLFGSIGDPVLREVVSRIKPRFHVFGHIHEDYGVNQVDGTTYINAACNTMHQRPVHPPIVFDIKVG